MPSPIITPVAGDAFGPGFLIELSSALVGPVTSDSYWEIELTAPANETIIANMTVADAIHTHVIHMAFINGATRVPSEVTPLSVTGMPGQLRVRLVQPEFGDAANETVAIVLDREAGVVQELTAIFDQKISAVPAGLTEEQANSLVITQAAVTTGFGLDPLTLIGDVVTAIGASNPLGYGSLSSPAQCYTGDGEIEDFDPIFPKWGLYWYASVLPSGLSHRHGQSEEYPSRLVQFRTVHEVGGVELVTELVDAITHGELWKFRYQRPRRVEYSILPGVTICVRWWQFP